MMTKPKEIPAFHIVPSFYTNRASDVGSLSNVRPMSNTRKLYFSARLRVIRHQICVVAQSVEESGRPTFRGKYHCRFRAPSKGAAHWDTGNKSVIACPDAPVRHR